MSELISGKDVFIALAEGEDVQVHESTYKEDVWFNLIETNFSSGEILTGKVNNKPYTLKFRLKPRTITLNVEIEKPNEVVLCAITGAVGLVYGDLDKAKAVQAALREVFK